MIDLKPACATTIAVIRGIGDDELGLSTPCPEMPVGPMVDHIDQVTRGATALAGHDAAEVARAGAAPDLVHLEPGWRDIVADRIQALGRAWDDPAVWDEQAGVPDSPFPNELWGKIVLTELVVHGWDLARATGQAYAPDDGTLRACFDHVAAFVPNAPVPGLWGPAVDVVSGAPLLDQIVAITGRTP